MTQGLTHTMCSVNAHRAQIASSLHTLPGPASSSRFQLIMKLPLLKKNPDYSAWLVPGPSRLQGKWRSTSQNCIQLSERICTKPPALQAPAFPARLPDSTSESEGESETLSRLCQHFPGPILLFFSTWSFKN